MEQLKTCTKCGETKPATREFWYFRHDRPVSWCKQCRIADVKARYDADPPKAREQAYAARRARADQLKQYNRDYYQLNRERKLQITHESMQRHRDKIRAKDRARARPTRENNRRLLTEWYSQGCVVCGLVFLPGGMQAHHRDEGGKDVAASQLLSARKGARAAELAKCDPLCATHHFMLTQAKRKGWEDKPYEELVAMLREQWQETLRAAGLRLDPAASAVAGDPSPRALSDAFQSYSSACREAPSWSKLTWDDVREIRRRHAAGGVTQRALCGEYGVTPATMCRLLQGKTWIKPG
jgi:hypothetical protein